MQARFSGTVDRAGSHLNFTCRISPGTARETLIPSMDFRHLLCINKKIASFLAG
ncbi:MAG: hypothetical protein ABSA76_03440 [Bacteroidales bacterium]